MSQQNERVSPFQFTRSWRSREDFPTYEASEDQVRDDLQRLFDELRDFLNAKLLPAVNAVSASEISAGESGTVQSALDALRADLAECVLGQIPDDSLTGAKLAPGALLEDITAQMTITEESFSCGAYQNLRACYSRALGLLFLQGTVRFTPGAAQSASARYRISGSHAAKALSADLPLACASDAGLGTARVFTSGSDLILDVRVQDIPSGTDTATASVSGWILCGEVSS